MNKTKNIAVAIALAMILMIVPQTAKALDVPVFPSCNSPKGNVKVHYQDGIHGVVGDTKTYRGEDTVYFVDGYKVLVQCLCPEGQDTGIQTNWLNAKGVSENEIKSFKYDGWNYIPTGAVWGLADDPYLAKNVTFACKEKKGEVLGLPSTGSNMLYGFFVMGAGIAALFAANTMKKKNA